MITSLKNERVRYVRALQRRRRLRQEEQRLVLEGVRLVEEAVRVGVSPSLVFYTQPATQDERGGHLLETLDRMGVSCQVVSEAVMAACSDTQTPQGILAVLPVPDLRRPEHPTFTLILDGVRDPGNLGTILRTALAAGAEQVLLAPGTVDASNPKVVRAAMGAHLHLPAVALRWTAIREAVSDCDVWLAAASGETSYTAVDWTRPVALIVGGEARGAGEQGTALAQGQVAIPISERVESLNTAVAAAVILFEIVRQRGDVVSGQGVSRPDAALPPDQAP